jgi:hypothetical protein
MLRFAIEHEASITVHFIHVSLIPYSDISVTQCKLVIEVTKQGEAPSKASGY